MRGPGSMRAQRLTSAFRAEKGPITTWMHKLGRYDITACEHCGGPQQTGHHLVSKCPHHQKSRSKLYLALDSQGAIVRAA